MAGSKLTLVPQVARVAETPHEKTCRLIRETAYAFGKGEEFDARQAARLGLTNRPPVYGGRPKLHVIAGGATSNRGE